MTRTNVKKQQLNLFENILPDQESTPVVTPGLTKQERILICIDDAGKSGCCCHEAERKLKFTHQSVSARIHDLRNLNKIFPLIVEREVIKRRTQSGKKAIVWVTKRFKVK
jgi:hypothetical protein